MRSRNFVDEKLVKEMSKIKSSGEDCEDPFPEHSFISACLKIGLSISELKLISYVDVFKIILSFLDLKNQSNGYRLATQNDWDNFASA